MLSHHHKSKKIPSRATASREPNVLPSPVEVLSLQIPYYLGMQSPEQNYGNQLGTRTLAYSSSDPSVLTSHMVSLPFPVAHHYKDTPYCEADP